MAVTRVDVIDSNWKKMSASDSEDAPFLAQHHQVSGRVYFAYTTQDQAPQDADMVSGQHKSPGHPLAPGQGYSREFAGWFWMRADEPTPVTYTE